MSLNSPILVTGGAGFIGSNFVLQWLAEQRTPVTVLDKLTYAGNLENLASVQQDSRYRFVCGDIVDGALVRRILDEQRPERSCILPRKAMWIAPFSALLSSFAPTSRGLFSCWRLYGDTGWSCPPSSEASFAFCTSPPMRSTAP
jgi:hypothetical protein